MVELWIDYFRERDTTLVMPMPNQQQLWIDYFRERDTTIILYKYIYQQLWIDYFRERDTTTLHLPEFTVRCGLITLGNEIQPHGT